MPPEVEGPAQMVECQEQAGGGVCACARLYVHGYGG